MDPKAVRPENQRTKQTLDQDAVSFSVGSIHQPSFGSGTMNKVRGLGLRGWGLGVRSWGLGLIIYGLDLRVWGWGLRVLGLGFARKGPEIFLFDEKLFDQDLV